IAGFGIVSPPLPASGADPGSNSKPYRSEENRDGEEEGEEEGKEAKAKCSFHEADEPERSARCRCRLQLNAAHRSDQEDLGLYQAQWPAGQEKPPHDQRGRQAQVRLRRQKPGVDVRDDQTGQPPPQVDHIQREEKAAGLRLRPFHLWYEVTRSTSFLEPRITATR